VSTTNPDKALVLFSGGQDSTVCLAWALERFASVETIGFDYGQRHRSELVARGACAKGMARLRPQWGARLGDDHVVRLDALAAISDTALTRDVAIEIGESGLPTTFVPAAILCSSPLPGARLSAWREAPRRRVCETDFSGYPDCRDDTVKAMQLALNLGMERRFVIHTPLIGSTRPRPSHSAMSSGASRSSTCWSKTPTPAISTTARIGMTGATAAGSVRPALARSGLRQMDRDN